MKRKVCCYCIHDPVCFPYLSEEEVESCRYYRFSWKRWLRFKFKRK